MTQSPPNGFTPHFRKSSFTDPWEPLFSKSDENQVKLGVYLTEAHCNSRGLVHGGFISAIADNAMGLSCGVGLGILERTDVKGLVTVSLATDFVGMAKVGEWLETNSRIVKLTNSIGFMSCYIQTGENLVASSTATFKIR